MGKAHEISRMMILRAQANRSTSSFRKETTRKSCAPATPMLDEKIATPILLGDAATIQTKTAELGLDLKEAKIVDPEDSPLREYYIQELYRLRQRRGVTLTEARTLIDDRNIFASMMLHMGDADALVAGATQHFPETIRPALQIVRVREGLHKVAGCYPMVTRKGELYFLADTSVNVDPTAEDLVEIALCTAQEARRFNVVPRVAMLSFSSFGSAKHPSCDKVRKAVELLHKADPTLIVDGEIMARRRVLSGNAGAAISVQRTEGRR